MTQPEATPIRPIAQVQMVRAFAALIVVIFHTQGELRHRGFPDPFPDLTVGAFGVDLFFVVSGFIMVYASDRLFGRWRAVLPFLARRLARIAPLYWAFTLLFAGIALTLGRLPGHPQASAFHIAASFLFLPAARPEDGAFFPVYSLGWTLNYEMFFYLCFAAALGLRRRAAVAAVSVGLIGLVALGRLVALPWPLFYWANPISLEFVFGLWIGTATLAGFRLPARFGAGLAAAALVAVLLYVPHIDDRADWRGLAWGLPAAGLLLASLGAGRRREGPAGRLAVRIGDASYSLYLLHSTLFIAVFAGLARIVDPHRIPAPAYAALLVCASVAGAPVLFRWFELPVTRALNRRIDRRAGRRAGTTAPAARATGRTGAAAIDVGKFPT